MARHNCRDGSLLSSASLATQLHYTGEKPYNFKDKVNLKIVFNLSEYKNY